MAKDRENLAALSLFPATPSQIIESRKTSFVQWNQGRTLVEYLERDSILDSLENSSNRKLTTW